MYSCNNTMIIIPFTLCILKYAGGNDAPNTVTMKLYTISMKMDNIESDDKTCSSPANDTCSAAKIEQLGQEYQTHIMRDEKFEKFCEMVGDL